MQLPNLTVCCGLHNQGFGAGLPRDCGSCGLRQGKQRVAEGWLSTETLCNSPKQCCTYMHCQRAGHPGIQCHAWLAAVRKSNMQKRTLQAAATAHVHAGGRSYSQPAARTLACSTAVRAVPSTLSTGWVPALRPSVVMPCTSRSLSTARRQRTQGAEVLRFMGWPCGQAW